MLQVGIPDPVRRAGAYPFELSGGMCQRVMIAIAVATRPALLIADASTKLASPVFYIKMIFVALALVNLPLLKTRVFGDPQIDERPLPSSARLLAITSLILWIAATTAGRLMAYLGPVSGLD